MSTNMVGLQDLTVGQVSGMIAAAVFVVQFLVPIILPVILLGVLRLRSPAATETAVSWSVIGRFLHSSLWPVFLRTDSAASLSASKSVLFMSFFRTFMLVLIAVAAIVTPLGLYEGIEPGGDPASQTFHYIQDLSTFGFGTPPRTNETGVWARICGFNLPYVCPNSPNKLFEFENVTGRYISTGDDGWYDSRIPQRVVEVFDSGLVNFGPSVSGPWDIQYRSYSKSALDTDGKGIPIDNGTTPYTKGEFRPLSSLILSDDIVPIEGLIVDMKNGGIGFRNHSAPTWQPYGSTWTEDILFIEPETVCVNTNLTLDFKVPANTTENLGTGSWSSVFGLVLTDHGGFVNLNQTYPFWVPGDTQADPMMWYRAYKAAWLSNALTMAWMNVTNIANDTTGVQAFSYLDSTLGKRFPLHYPDGSTATSYNSIRPSALDITTTWGEYLDRTDEGRSNISSLSNTTYDFPSKEPIYANPFNISLALDANFGPGNFSTIPLLCAGAGDGDLANMTNLAATCGLLYGAPRRRDGSASLLFDPGSDWTLPMYSCVSAVKALIKTVHFGFNGSDDDLSALSVISIKPKQYPNDEAKPLWAVENTDMLLREGNPLWGIVTPESAAKLNVSSVRKEHLYLPGLVDNTGLLTSHENLPGVDFYSKALSATYQSSESGSSVGGSPSDYTGGSNLAMYRRWQELSRDTTSAAKILNLIWTDIALNMVVGTKGLQPQGAVLRKRDEFSSGNLKTPQVTSYTRRIRYKYAYGIPAFLALVLTGGAAFLTLWFLVFGQAKPSALRTFLQHTSAGRFLTSQAAYGGYASHGQIDSYSNAPTSEWVKGAGKQEFTLGAEGWMKNVQAQVPGYVQNGGSVVSYMPVPNNGY